jgi:drug/metabolite transporter (DMT)-like permease
VILSPKIAGILLMVLVAAIGAVGQVFFKKAAPGFSISFDLIKNVPFIIACSLYAITLVLAMVAYRKAEVSVLYPVMSLSYIFLIILASMFLGEKITPWKVGGSLLIIGGVAMIGLA